MKVVWCVFWEARVVCLWTDTNPPVGSVFELPSPLLVGTSERLCGSTLLLLWRACPEASRCVAFAGTTICTCFGLWRHWLICSRNTSFQLSSVTQATSIFAFRRICHSIRLLAPYFHTTLHSVFYSVPRASLACGARRTGLTDSSYKGS